LRLGSAYIHYINFGKILTTTNPTESLITHTTLNTGALLVPLIKKAVTVQHTWVNFNTCNKVAIIAEMQVIHTPLVLILSMNTTCMANSTCDQVLYTH